MRRLLFSCVIIFLITFPLFSCESSTQITERTLENYLELVGNLDTERGEYGNIYITGILRNKSNKELSYASIDFPICDKAGNKIGTAMDNINNLKPGQRWKFKALIIEGSVCRGSTPEIMAF